MILGFFILAVALIISLVSAFYSITGLVAIFAGAFWPIVIMGSVLELGKITATVWIHKYWHRVTIQFKLYLVPAIMILMLITSIGVFGLLSKAHSEQSVYTGDIASQIQIIDDKIKTEQTNIDTNKKALVQMDAQVDQLLSRTTDSKGATKAAQLRKSQFIERKQLNSGIIAAQTSIAALKLEQAPIASTARKVEADIGPIKYIAALVYGDNPDSNLMERAVRWVIILLVFVFDPLAIILILAADQTFEWAAEDKDKITQNTDGKLPTDDNTNNDTNDIKLADFFERGHEIAKELDANNNILTNSDSPYLNKPWPWIESDMPPRVADISLEKYDETIPNQPIIDYSIGEDDSDDLLDNLDLANNYTSILNEPSAEVVALTNTIAQTEADLIVAIRLLQEKSNAHNELLEKYTELQNVMFDLQKMRNAVYRSPDTVIIPNMTIIADNKLPDNTVGYGSSFPLTPIKGDMFLRTDYLPSKLYKWNDQSWLEVDKNTTDQYSYHTEYIKYLVNKLQSGEYDYELLTPAELDQIAKYINATTRI